MEILSLKLSEHIYMVCDNGKSYEKDFGTWSYGDMGLCNEKWIFEKGTCRILDQLVEEYKQNFNKSHQTDKNYKNMNAHQARDVANKVNTDVINSQYRKIKSLIDYEANEGNFELWYYESIRQSTMSMLEGEGFHVTIASERQGDYSVKITW